MTQECIVKPLQKQKEPPHIPPWNCHKLKNQRKNSPRETLELLCQIPAYIWMHDNNVEVLPDVDFAKITQWLAKKPKYEFLWHNSNKTSFVNIAMYFKGF